MLPFISKNADFGTVIDKQSLISTKIGVFSPFLKGKKLSGTLSLRRHAIKTIKSNRGTYREPIRKGYLLAFSHASNRPLMYVAPSALSNRP